MKNFINFRVLLVALFGLMVLGVSEAYAGGTAYSRARAYLRSDAPSGSGKVYVGQAATSSPNYQTSSSSEKQGEKTTTTYHFYAQPATGYKFTGWYSKNANDEYVAAPNSTVSGTTYTYTNTHYVVNVTSGSNPSSGTSYTDKDLYAGFIKIVQLSFIRPEDGSFTIMHNGAAVADYASFTVDGKVVLTATPDAGYKLRGWYTTTDGGVTKNYFAFAEEIEPTFTSNVTIGAEFVLDDGKADFWVKGTTTTYNDLNEANTRAAAGSKVIVLVNSGTLPAGTYTISSGVTLLIPYGSDYSKLDQPNIVHVTGIGSAPALSVYKKLSLAAGATINCSGKICVGGQMMSINGGNPTSVVRGRAGVIDLSRGGQINLNSGSALYAWGFVQGQDIDQGNNTSGVGKIDAKSGSTVWEVFQCGEWRGGTASSSIYSNRSSWKFFPFQSYTVQNIEAPITYRSGATGKCKWTIFGDGKIYTVDFTLIGSSNALFNMGSGATLNKRYDATTDRICYELNGTNAVNALSLSAMGETINSSEYRLPIPANMQITVTGGTTSISNQMVLHAGAYVDIRSGATLNINTNVYIFDQTDWDTYCMYKYYYRSYKSLTKHYDRGEGTSKATLEDATVIVDGNLTFGGSGRLYATTNGANIKGNNGGRITFGTLPTKTTIVMCKELKDNVSVSVSSANMHNIDNSYTKAIASTAFHNVNGRWFAAADKDPKADHTYKFTYIKSGDKYGTGGTNATVNTLYRSGWIDVKADVCDNWWKGLNDTYLYNYTFNNAWHQYEQTPTVIGEGDEAATIYSGTDGKLYAKSACTWEEYSGADENCLQTIGGVKKAFVNGAFVALTKNTEDEAYHNTANATEYYICFKDICEWHAATKVAGTNKAYTVTATSQKYIWYNGAWLAATQESPYFYTRSESGEKTYYEYVGSAWTEANVVAESTRNGAMTRYFNLPDAFTDANDNTKPGESTTIKIMKNVTITSALTYRPVDAKGGTCTIDLNGFTLSGSIDNMITINHDKAVLVVLDQSPEESGKISISYSANNTRRRAVYVQNGRLMLNSGTIQATNSQAYADAIYVNANELCDINGGQVKATATSGAYGVHTAGGTARCTIKGGTITASSPASKGVYSEGGEIRMSAGTVNATTTGTEAIGLATTAAATSTINLTGGTVTASADASAYGVQFGASTHTGTATISGGIITANTTNSNAYGIYSAGKTTVGGGKIYANAKNYAYGAYGYSTNQLTINTTDTIHAKATTRYAYGIYTYGASAKLWVNGGVIDVNTARDAYGLYAKRGTDTINGGEFLITATGASRAAHGMYLEATSPKVVVNGGKFKVTAATKSIYTIATGGVKTQLSLAGGYYNIAPADSCVAAGKEVKDLDATVEASLISAGYTKKIAGTEYTVTWKNRGGAVIKTEKVESGKVPVYTGPTPTYSDAWGTYEFIGWATTDGGAVVSPLPAIGASDVTYFARYRGVYADVTANGTTTRYYNVNTAWTAAKAYKQAYIKVLCSAANLDQLVFNPTPADAIITLDLNGYHWGMGSNADPAKNKAIFLEVNKAGCKLIITDSRGGGYINNTWSSTGAVLTCAKVTAGELILQGGEIRANNTGANGDNKKYSLGIQVNGGTQFTMTGGKVYATDAYSPRGVNVSPSGNADIVGGIVHADATGGNAYGVLAYGTISVGGDALIKATTAGSGAYPGYVDGGTLTVADSCSIVATAPSGARGFYALKGGKVTVNDKPTITATVTSGNEAYGGYVSGSGSEIEVNGGTYELTGAAASGSVMGVRAISSGVATINNGTFTLQGGNNWTFGVFAQTGTVNINGGDFTVSQASGGNKEGIRVYPGGTCNITGGTFTVTTIGSSGGNALHAYGGTTNISGNPVFNAYYGITVADGNVASEATTATVVVDGGTYNTQSFGVKSRTTSPTTGDVTIWDGMFNATWNAIESGSEKANLKIRGGYYTNNSGGKLSVYNESTNPTGNVVSPSTVEALTSGPEFEAGYKYRVNTKYNVTWSVNGNTTVQEYNRNETPSYGSTPTISDGNTYEFLGWSPEIAPVTTDVTYTAQFRKWEAEVIEGESATGTKFESFADAWNIAKNMPVAKIKILSNVYYGTGLTLNPDSASGSRPLTIDLNNHVVNYTKTDATYALTINKAGCKLIIDDSSVAKGGQFGHRQTANNGASISAIYIQNGELELAGGTIIAQNNNIDSSTDNSKGTRAVVGNSGTVFMMTGGKLYAKSRFDARCYNSGGTGTFNATGGTIEATNEYTESSTTKWGSSAYGVVLWNNGTFNMSGTAVMNVHTGSSAVGAYAYGPTAVANISGGTITTISEGSSSKPVNAANSGVVNISGGDITATGHDGDGWSTEAVSCSGGNVTITGGSFHSVHGANCNGVRVYEGTVTISGNPYFDSRNGIAVGDWATKESCTATVYVNGGTFVCPGYTLYSRQSTNKYSGDLDGTVTGTTYVNGGYFKSTGSTICNTSSQAGRLILNGGYYSESAGTTQKTNITTYKGATTEVSTLSPVVHDAYSNDYHYQLLTDFDVTWLGGSTYSKVEQVKSGTVPSNTELVGKCFIRNDSAFYFTGWSPTPSTVVGDVTYQAVGDYYEAEVKIGSGAWTRYTDFLEAWDVVQANANCTIRLLSNFTLADKILYKPTVANARTVFDLNNFTMTIGGTSTSGIDFNKADAVLTITDGSSAKGGKISMTRNTPSSTYTIYIYNGELKLTGGKIYVQNNQDKVNDSSWWPAIAVYVSTGANAKLTMTGGTVESQAAYLAYALYNYGTTNISGGTVRANATATGNSLGIYAVNGTATISGGTFNITASSIAVAATATGFINNTGSVCNNGTLNITGGTFNVSATNQSAWALSTNGTGKTISGTVYKAHGVINVSGGTFNVSCPVATATQVFAVQCNGWRLFDGATPHAMLAEELSEMNISGGTFTVDTRNSGAWLDNGGNVDLLRCWGSLNVSGGTFTIYQYKTPNAIQVYRGKATVSGNPVFNVYSHTANARGITAAGWTHNDYCDKDATKNIAEAEINGGTFKIITEGANTEGFLASGTTSAGGYAMNAKITVNGGTFLTICPNASGHYPIMLSSAADRAGTYGTATSEIYVNGGRFKSRKGTEADNTSSGAVNAHNATGKIWLTGGYYETNAQLSARVADTCLVTTLTSAEMDPEYANGYRYRIDVDYQAKVTVGAVERKFALFRDAFNYAKTQNNATITLLRNINYEGLNFMYNPSSVRSCTLDLNGFTFTGAVSGHTGDASYNNDRLLVINKAGATFTIKDSSVGKTGKWSHEKAGATFPVIVYHGKFVLQSGTVHGKNTSGGSVQAIRSENYADALVSVTGGKAHAETSGAAYGMSTYNKATISGGEIIAESSAGEAFGVYTNAAEDTTVISGGRIYAAGTNGYGVRSASIMTISGGKIIGESINTTGAAYGVSVAQSTTTITGADSIYAHATKNAYGVYSAGTGVATINGGQIISRNGDSNGSSITTYAINSGTININNGIFYAQRDGAGTSNIQTTRTGNNAIMNITGGTFHAEGYQAVNARGGTTTISGGTFYGTTGICAMDWADAATITANVSVTGGTFDCTGVCLNVRSNNSNNSGKNGHSEVTISGGKFKTTGSTIAQLVQVDGTDPSTLTITGGYFNEKSSTTHRDQIAGFVTDTCKITDITSAVVDPEYNNGYRYRVDVDYRVKVTHAAVEKKFVTLNQAFEYAKAQTNPTITLIGNANFTGPYSLNPTVANWQGILDLNNFTITSLQSASFADRYFTLNRSDMKLTVTDNSGAKGGVWNMVGAGVTQSYMIGIVVGLGELELAGGKIYVENNNASQSVTGINTWCSTINKAFYTQTGGTLEAKSAKSATALTIYGATTISGGEVKATTTTGASATAFSLGSHDGIIGSLTVNGSPTITVNTATSSAYGIYSAISGGTVSISSGTFNITSGTTSAFGVYLQTNPSTVTISGGTFNITSSGDGCRGLYLESGNGTINVSGGTFNVTTATSGSASWYNIEGMRLTRGTGTINCTGGTFNVTNKSKASSCMGVRNFAGTLNLSGTVEINANRCFYISDTYISEATAYVNISGGTFNSVSNCILAKNTEGTGDNAGKFTSADFTVTGGKFKTTGANHIDAATPTSVLHLQGGYFTERSGTTSKTNLLSYVSDPYEVLNLDTDDAEYIAGYRYIVANAPVAKVKVGGAVTYHPTVAAAFTAANAATSASTITMLKDATATSYLHYTGAQNCTLDLNGHTISYDGTTTEHRLLRINHADITFTVTDNTVSKEGKLLFNTSKAATSYGVVVIAGNFQLDAGTIEMHASGGTAEGVTAYNSGTSVTINGGKVYVVTTNSQPGYGVYSKTGTTTINGGTIQVEAAGAGYGIYYSAGTTTVTDGKFNVSGSSAYATNLSSANAKMIIQGGWYNTNTRLKPNAPYQVLSLAGQSPYLYEVAEAYTLTWTTDGDPLTGSYTSGLTKPGTTITAPNTPTKTGYTFASWHDGSSVVTPSTMPSENTTYTATWTINSYDVTFNMQGHGSAIAKQTINYNGLVTEPATPTEANYVFGGWYKEAGCTNAWNFATDHVTAATTLYAKWTPAVASVQKGAASPTYHTTLADAFETASSTAKNATVTITVLQNISGITEQINYAPTNVCTTTLDLNGYKVEGSVTSDNARLISFGKQGAVLEITDSRTGGELHNEAEFNSTLLCVYVNYGHLKISGGTISVKNTSTGSSQYAYAIQTRSNASTSNVQLTMTSGTVKAEGAYRVYALYPQCESNISGGRIEANATGTGYAVGIFANPKSGSTATIGGSVEVSVESGKDYAEAIRAYGTVDVQGGTFDATSVATYAYGIRTYTGTTTVTNNPSFTIRAKQCAIGVQAGERPSTSGGLYDGTAVIRGGTFDVSTTTPAKSAYTKAYGVLAYAHTRQGKTGHEGNYASAGTIDVYDGTFEVNGYSAVYGIYSMGTVTLATEPYESASATAKMNIYGGKFKVLGTSGKAAIGATSATITNTDVVIEGGYYNINTNLDQYTATTKSCNYYCLETTAADKASVGSDYNYKVAEAYTLTWNLDGGTVTTAGTGAAVDATGTPSIVWGVGDAITAPTIVRDGYTFAAWTPAVAATMPSSNTTYTAQWAVASVTTNDVTTLYTNMTDAWTAVNNATAETTLKLLQDISTSSTEAKMLYENAQNCTLDLNGHTLSMTNTASQSPLHIKRADVTFTITDGTVDKLGKLSMTSSSTSTIFGAYVENGTLVLEAGTIEVKNSGTRATCGVTALTTGTFTMNGGTIHVVATNGQEGRGLYFNGTMTVNSGTIHVEAAGDGYGINRDNSGGTATVNDGKFNITSSSGTPYITNQTNNTYVKIYGGYYNINSRLGTCVSAPKYVFRTTAADKASVGEDYEYKVTTGYVITYNKGANGTGTIASGTKAHGDDFTLSSSTFTRTGYTQTGWSTSDGGAKVYELGGTYSENADLTVYPFWTAQNYTVTLNSQAATTPGTASIEVTYGSNANLTATPAITVPTKTGYTFGGYYVDQGGIGKQVIAANGNVNASVSGITDASKNWIAATGGTIYAKWTQTVTLHDNNGGIHNGSLEVTYNLAYKSGTPPTREGYTAEGYYAEPACTNKVLTTAGVWVNYSGWVEDGKWVHDGESTLYTKWIEDTHTVTVAAGANGSASPASVSGVGITTASGDITATPNTGYHFTNWTLVSGVTAASTYTASSNPIRINATADGKTITANFAPNTDTEYKVKHYQQNLDGSYPSTPTEIDNLTGTTGASVTPAVKSYTGFTAPSTQTETIAADGSLVIEYQYTRNSYTLTWALDGGSITAAGTAAGSVKYGASLTAPTVTKAGYNFTGWSPSVPSTMPAANSTYTATWEQADLGAWLDIVDVDNTNSKLILNVTSWAASGWPYTINGVEYAKNAREADRTLKIPYVGTPGDNYAIMVKKTGGEVISHHTYVIPQEITSNTTITANQTKSLYVKDGVNLTVNANITAHNIYVAPEATLTINSGKTLTADSIFLRTTADHAAEMVLSGNLAGTTQLVYTRIIKDKDFHLFGIPLSCSVEDVHLSDGFVPTYKTGWVLRYYNEKRRSNEGADDNNWVTVKEDSTITGGSGYELFSGSNYYREFYFPVDHKELTNEVAVVYDLGAAGEKHAGWNAITSPFTSTYTNVKVPEGLAVSWYMGGYYSQEIPTTIPAATVFAFQATKTGTISFEGESIVAALPRRAATEEAVRIQWLDLDIADANGVGDQTSIYSHPTRYDAVFQKGIDIAKQSFEAPRAIIYSSHAYGEMAFAGVADSLLEQGVALTVYSPTAQPLTISMRDNDWLNRMKYVWLIDHQTGERTDLLWENYTYEASEGTTRGRFTIQGVFRTPTITTDIENGMMNDESMQVEKFILNDKIYIRVNGHLYDATGKLVNRK